MGVTPDWSDAACAGQDTEIFYAAEGMSGVATRRRAEALARALTYCDRCPIRAACLEFALANEGAYAFGVWGGTTGPERSAYLARKLATRRKSGRRTLIAI